MAFKIVNGKLVRITSQADFGTPAQKKAGRRITGTLGVISETRAPARRIEEVFRPPKPSARPSGPIQRGTLPAPSPPPAPSKTAAPMMLAPPTAAAPVNQLVSPFTGRQPSATTPPPSNIFPASETLLGSFQGIGPSPVLPALPFADPGVRQGDFLRGLTSAQLGGATAPTGTLGLGKPQQITDRTQFSVPSRVGEIVTGGELRQQNFLKTLNNPRTLGEVEYIGALPSIQAALAAYLRGEDVNPAFVRFFFNQGLVTADADGQLTLTSDGQGTLDAGRITLVNRAPLFSGEPGRFSGTRGASLGLTNWRI